MKPCVYTYWDSCGRVIYVGRSQDAFRRLAQHKQAAEWIDDVSHITIEHVDTSAQAEMLERRRIEQLKPIENTVGLAWADRTVPRCAICQEDITHQELQDPIRVCQMVQGYEKKRVSGGANQIALRKTLGIHAHRWCIEHHDHDRNQLQMFDAPRLG